MYARENGGHLPMPYALRKERDIIVRHGRVKVHFVEQKNPGKKTAGTAEIKINRKNGNQEFGINLLN